MTRIPDHVALPIRTVEELLYSDRERSRRKAACESGAHLWTSQFNSAFAERYCDRCGIPKKLFESRRVSSSGVVVNLSKA